MLPDSWNNRRAAGGISESGMHERQTACPKPVFCNRKRENHMHEIILKQHDAARKLDGKGFVLGIAGILLCLSIAQIVCNWLISLTGIGLLNLAFYLVNR